jgi:DedD protein
MDPALKKRLLGAALLIVLAIIFVPMLFTGRPHERTESVDLNLPKPPDRDFTTRTVPLATTPRPAPAPDAVSTVDTEKLAVSPPAPVEPASKSAPPPEPASKAPLATIAAAAAKPANGAQSSPTPAASAPAKVEETSEGSSEHGRYGVSFGTYGKPENADKLVADLKRAGVAAYSEPVEVKGESALRVRSGPYLDRSQAEKARLLARGARGDAPGRLIELDETTAPSSVASSAAAKPAAPPPAPAGKPRTSAPVPSVPPATTVTGWAVQLGAYQNETDANGRRDALRKAGFSAYVEPVNTQKGKLYRLRVGPAAERAGADKLRAELKEKMKLEGTVVQEP